MTDSISFTILGEPRGKQRARVVAGRAYTPKETVEAERAIGWEAKRAMAGRKLLEGPVVLVVEAWFGYPESWTREEREATRAKTSKPDLDNIVKLVKDAMNGVVWKDDAQVVALRADKFYGEPRLAVEVWAMSKKF